MGLFTRKSADPRKELRDILGDYELPTLRTTVISTLRLLRDDNATGEQIAQQIELDPGIHTRVLRSVNAASFGLPTKVTTVLHAVSLLGRSRLEPLVLGLGVKESLPSARVPGFDAQRFWHRSAVRAMAARGFARHLHPGTQNEAFAAGLLVDLAVPVLASVKGSAYVDAYQAGASDPGADVIELERDALGHDHTAAGLLIAEAWDLPDYLCDAIAHHHDAGGEGLEPGVRLAALIRDQDELSDVERVASHAGLNYEIAEEDAVAILESAFQDADQFSGLGA